MAKRLADASGETERLRQVEEARRRTLDAIRDVNLDTMTPYERYQHRAGELGGLRGAGLDETSYDRAIKLAKGQLLGELPEAQILFRGIESGFDQMIQGMVDGTLNFGQVWRSTMIGVASDFGRLGLRNLLFSLGESMIGSLAGGAGGGVTTVTPEDIGGPFVGIQSAGMAYTPQVGAGGAAPIIHTSIVLDGRVLAESMSRNIERGGALHGAIRGVTG